MTTTTKIFGMMHIDNNPSLSLFLCKQIIDILEGQIEISNTGKGVLVKISLPKTSV